MCSSALEPGRPGHGLKAPSGHMDKGLEGSPSTWPCTEKGQQVPGNKALLLERAQWSSGFSALGAGLWDKVVVAEGTGYVDRQECPRVTSRPVKPTVWREWEAPRPWQISHAGTGRGGREAGTGQDRLEGGTLEPGDSGLPGLWVAGVQCQDWFGVSLLTRPLVRGAVTGLGLAGASSLGQNGWSQGPRR